MNTIEQISTETFSTNREIIQITQCKYRGVIFTERYISPNFWGLKPKTMFYIDLQLPMNSYPCISDGFYTEEGYGLPLLETETKVKEFIDNYLVA
jgi:hypothetical protein